MRQEEWEKAVEGPLCWCLESHSLGVAEGKRRVRELRLKKNYARQSQSPPGQSSSWTLRTESGDPVTSL